MKRSDFLRLTSLALAGTLLPEKLLARRAAILAGYDALIVGTGYGSAVSALRLAEAGKKVLMLEMGMDWKASGLKFSKMAWAEDQSTWLKTVSIAPFGNFRVLNKFTGVLDRIDFENVKVYAGRGVGGGSLVNGAMSVTPKRSYFKEIFPELDDEAFYTRYFPRANAELGVTTIPEEYYQRTPYYRFSRMGEAEAQKAGFKTVRVPSVYDYDYMQQEEAGRVPKSALDGEVIYGNNHGKKDLTKTYLRKALATNNVVILPLHKAEQLIQNQDQSYTLKVHQLNTKGEVAAVKYFTTNRLFLGGGSLGTTELLLKSKAMGTLPGTPSEVGQFWGNNGNIMAGRNFVAGGTGDKQSTMPAAGVDNWDDPVNCFFTEIAPLPIGIETLASLYLSINRVPRLASLSYDGATRKLTTNWGAYHNQHMIENTRFFVDKMNAANGGTYASLLFNKGIGADICYHPLGGCVLGKATDSYGRIKGLPGVYAVDGSLIPGTIGVNPYVTITAIAEYCLENIVATDFTDATVAAEVSIPTMNAYPNPFSSQLTVEFTSVPGNEPVSLQLVNWAGSIVARKTATSVKGLNTVLFDGLSGLWKENYTLRVMVGEAVYTRRVSK